MKSIDLYPTANFGDCFALFSYLSVYQSQYDKYTLRVYGNNVDARMIICNFPALLKSLAVLDYQKYSDVYVFGESNSAPFHSVMIFKTYYDFLNGNRCIKFY